MKPWECLTSLPLEQKGSKRHKAGSRVSDSKVIMDPGKPHPNTWVEAQQSLPPTASSKLLYWDKQIHCLEKQKMLSLNCLLYLSAGPDGEGDGPSEETRATVGTRASEPRPCCNLQDHPVCQLSGRPRQLSCCPKLPPQRLCSGE